VFGAHSVRRMNKTPIYRRNGNLRAVPLLQALRAPTVCNCTSGNDGLISIRDTSETDNADTKIGSSDLPVGRFVDSGVQSHLQKYFASPVGQIISTNSRHSTPPKGRIAIVTDAGCGCGGRGSVLRAMGSQGGFFEPVSDQ